LVRKHHIAYHEKAHGQLFCDTSSNEIIAMLLKECADAGVTLQLATPVRGVHKTSDEFSVTTPEATFRCASLVIASGGLSIPKMGATGLGYDIARQFGISIVPTSAGLVPFTLKPEELKHFSTLSGVALEAVLYCKKQHFREAMLFTHRGLSGPAVLQLSSYWQQEESITINLSPEQDVAAFLKHAKATTPRQELSTALSHLFPKRIVGVFLDRYWPVDVPCRMADLSHKRLDELGQIFHRWHVTPDGTEGYRTAEVTLGGVDTRALSSKSMECRDVPGLFFIGEVVDVTGHLGGFNFQWAWSSGFAAGQYV